MTTCIHQGVHYPVRDILAPGYISTVTFELGQPLVIRIADGSLLNFVVVKAGFLREAECTLSLENCSFAEGTFGHA